MVGYLPEYCPFCGALQKNFITAKECSEQYELKIIEIKKNVSQVLSTPKLGLEHAAYQIKTENKIVWIDCPSTFKNTLDSLDFILFTHHHFLGTSNLYKEYYDTKVHIHKEDSNNYLSKYHNFDVMFENNFILHGIEAFHINGHTKGFTFYIFDDLIFICDYFFVNNKNFRFNPYGSETRTQKGGIKLKEIIEGRPISIVCGVDYVLPFNEWYESFIKLSPLREDSIPR
jgi:hydroxyacylglutathione hydrolase